MGGPSESLVGKVFGNLTVLVEVARRPPHRIYTCRCTCGNENDYYANNLKKGNSKGCRSCSDAARRGVAVTHGMANTPMYNAYRTMVNRCTDPKHIQYADYGGRGITVCDRWKESFENFFADMGLRPEGHSIERKDNSKGYEPDNCVWATPEEQARNKRNTLTLTYKGVTKPLQTWAEERGHHPKKLAKRLRLGWSHEDILTRP